ncbi:MAG TPA: GNAT family N-acetyltransferase [Candidatus Deferrimicrobiaceae bacterium]|nr:GNAT family N-acetyltransferase [Candidatus Deferrimicrobiaceae bacterium]
MAEVAIRRAKSDEDLETFAAITTMVLPESGVTVDDMRWSDRTYPGGARFIGSLDGLPVGAGGVGRVYVFGPEFPGLWTSLSVLPEARRRGVGDALYRAVSLHARVSGKQFLVAMATEDHPESIAFLRHRGFEERERAKTVRLPLAGLDGPDVAPPPGIEITTLEARPDLAHAIYDVAVEALPDVPGDAPQVPGSLEEFLARDVTKPTIPPWGFAVAVDAATGRPVGYANLAVPGGGLTLGWHHMTAVSRAWRGRGVASALKRATIRAAIEHGLEALEGQNDIQNAPMREINRRLGYLPRADEIIFHGPLAPSADAESAAAAVSAGAKRSG